MRHAVRAIIIRDNKELLVMHRNKFGMEYDTLIGGGVEMGETIEQAFAREVAEETGLTVTNPRLVFIEQPGAPYGTQYVFVCDYTGGEPVLSDDAGEQISNKMGKNLYEPRWLALKDLPKAPFRSERLKQAILDAIEHGFPAEPLDITG